MGIVADTAKAYDKELRHHAFTGELPRGKPGPAPRMTTVELTIEEVKGLAEVLEARLGHELMPAGVKRETLQCVLEDLWDALDAFDDAEARAV